MKETKTKAVDPVVITKQVEAERQLKYLGSIKPRRGHLLFEINTKTGTICPAVFEEAVVAWDEVGTAKKKKKLLIKEFCVYVPALNEKNAVKRFNKTYPE